MNSIRLIPPIVTLLATGLVACGGSGENAKKFSGEEQNVAQVVDDLQSAAKDGDGQKICDDIFSPNLKNSVTKASGDCASKVVKPLQKTKFTVKDVNVSGSKASAQVDQSTGGTVTISFAKANGDWKMTGASPNLTSKK